MLRILLVYLTLLTCCGPGDPRNVLGIDPEFIDYFNEFEEICGVSPYMVTAGFRAIKETDPTTGGAVLGLCYMVEGRYPEVVIDPKVWARANDDIKIRLIFHELVHCVFDRDHDYDVTSLMYPTLFWAPAEMTKDQLYNICHN